MAVVQSEQEARGLSTVKRLVIAAIAAAAVSAAAGLALLAFSPEAGSGTEATLGISAAVGGMAVGVLIVSAMIYAQTKNLWRFAPRWVRVAGLALIIYGVAMTVWNLVDQASQSL